MDKSKNLNCYRFYLEKLKISLENYNLEMYTFNKSIYTNNKIIKEKIMADDKKGMLRHVDVLGRVVIPREVRKAMRINYGDLMEFYACSNQQVIMRKFHLLREITDLINSLIRVVRLGRDCDIFVLDTEKVVCKNGEKDVPSGNLNKNITDILNNRNEKIILETLNLTDDLILNKQSIIIPIIAGGDLLGGVIVNADNVENFKAIGKEIANFLSEYFSA